MMDEPEVKALYDAFKEKLLDEVCVAADGVGLYHKKIEITGPWWNKKMKVVYTPVTLEAIEDE